MSKLTKRVNLVMSKEDRRHLEAMALSNAGGNDSAMVRELIRRAVQKPQALGLNAPFVSNNQEA